MSKLNYLDRVKQPTTTTGTGDIVFSGSVAGYNPLSSHSYLSYGAPFPYLIEAVDANGVPTGEWETGVGRLRGVGDANPTHMRRLTVKSSSNADALVNFSAGTKLVSICVNADLAQWLRSQTAEFWVRPDGNDNNDGGADSADRAFQSIQAAVNAAVKHGDKSSVFVTAGTYSETVSLPPYPMSGDVRMTIEGMGTNRNDVVIANGLYCTGQWDITWLKIGNAYPGHAVSVINGGYLKAYDVDFGAVNSGAQICAEENSTFWSDYHYISGSADSHIRAELGGVVTIDGSIELLANATYSSAFADCLRGAGSFNLQDATFTLGAFSVTGKRYDIRGNGVCWTNGGGASFLPGNAAGTTASGGQYL